MYAKSRAAVIHQAALRPFAKLEAAASRLSHPLRRALQAITFRQMHRHGLSIAATTYTDGQLL
jgi:hypothetical protein